VGVLLGLLGAYTMFKRERGLFLCWLAIFGPYTYFYMCYGATDRDTMFGPSYLAWTVAMAYGLQRVTQLAPRLARSNLLFGLPLLALIINFPAVNLSKDTAVRDNARAVLQSLPPNAVVGGYWADVAPLQYIHFVEKERPDVTIYDLFLFKPDTFHNYMDVLGKTGKRPIVFVTNAALTYVFGTDYTVTPILINLQDQRDPFKLVFVAAPPRNNVLLYNTGAHN
jgi:hypothetical protein